MRSSPCRPGAVGRGGPRFEGSRADAAAGIFRDEYHCRGARMGVGRIPEPDTRERGRSLAERSSRAQEQYFSWRVIAARYADALGSLRRPSNGKVSAEATLVAR